MKTVTAGEGGMVLTNDDDLARKVRMYAVMGWKEIKNILKIGK